MSAFHLSIFLLIANYIWEFTFGSGNYDKAIEHSYFQAIALGLYAVMNREASK